VTACSEAVPNRQIMEKKRVEYIDCYRGFAMVLVVFTHVWGFSLGIFDNVLPVTLASLLMLPIFFFVSGYLTHIQLEWKSFAKRALTLFPPTIVALILYFVCKNHSFSNITSCLDGEYKYGYWFPIALIIMNFMHLLVCQIAKLGKRYSEIFTIIILCLAVVGIIALKDWDWNRNEAQLCRWFSLRLISMYFPFYLFGLLCKKYKLQFVRLLEPQWLSCLFFLAFILLIYVERGGFYKNMVLSFIGVFLSYRFFFHSQQFFSSGTAFGRQMVKIGQDTMSIYLIHYFLLFGLQLQNFGEYFDAPSQWLIVSCIALLESLLVVYGSIFVSAFLKKILINLPIIRR